MKKILSVKEMQAVSASLRRNQQTLGFVPTMGFLHEGHLSLMKEAVRRCDQAVVSIFVNPLQFGPDEDFERYPRDPEGDFVKCSGAGVHYLFSPGAEEIIGKESGTMVKMEKIMERFCGASRPGHFQGVATIVLKLLNIIQPEVLFLGAKDFQQTVIIKKMVRDFFIPVQVEVLPTVREPDGLAMSSRNSYLNRAEWESAAVLYRAMKKGEAAFKQGEYRVSFLRLLIVEEIQKEKLVKIDYVEIVHPETLEGLVEIREEAQILLAVWIGKIRLIDNLRLKL